MGPLCLERLGRVLLSEVGQCFGATVRLDLE